MYLLTVLVVSVPSVYMIMMNFDPFEDPEGEEARKQYYRRMAGVVMLHVFLAILFFPLAVCLLLGLLATAKRVDDEHRVLVGDRELWPEDICRDPRHAVATVVMEVLAGCIELRSRPHRMRDASGYRSDARERTKMQCLEAWECDSWLAIDDLAATFDEYPLGQPPEVVPQAWVELERIARSQLEGINQLRDGEIPISTAAR